MKTLGYSLVGIFAFLLLILASVWLEARVRFGDFLLCILSAIFAAVIWYLAFKFCMPKP